MLDFGSPNTLKPSAFLYVSAVITLAVRNLADSGAYRGLVGRPIFFSRETGVNCSILGRAAGFCKPLSKGLAVAVSRWV